MTDEWHVSHVDDYGDPHDDNPVLPIGNFQFNQDQTECTFKDANGNWWVSKASKPKDGNLGDVLITEPVRWRIEP